MGQKFYIGNSKRTWPNGAVGYGAGGSFDNLGPYAKVQNCPVEGTDKRYTVYATGYADTFFSIPACTQVKGKHVGGFITHPDEEGPLFVPYNRFRDRL